MAVRLVLIQSSISHFTAHRLYRRLLDQKPNPSVFNYLHFSRTVTCTMGTGIWNFYKYCSNGTACMRRS
jgi:hypothetical protein